MSGFHEANGVHALRQGQYDAPSTGTDATLESLFRRLELYDSTPSCASVKLPSDARLVGENRAILNFLVDKIMARLCPTELIQNVNIDYHDINQVQPGRLLLLISYQETEGRLRADIFSETDLLVTKAYAFIGQPAEMKVYGRRSLRSPISLESLESFFRPLELYDSTPSYAYTKFDLPNDARLGGAGILNFLICKIMAPLFPADLVQSVNIYYYNISGVQLGRPLFLTSHWEKEGMLRAVISSTNRSMVAIAYALMRQPAKIKVDGRKSLGSPISLDPEADRRVMRATSFTPEKQTSRGKDPYPNGPNYLRPDTQFPLYKPGPARQ